MKQRLERVIYSKKFCVHYDFFMLRLKSANGLP